MTSMLHSFSNNEDNSFSSAATDHVFSNYRESDDKLYSSQYSAQTTVIETNSKEKNSNTSNHDKLTSPVLIGKPFSALINSLIPSPEFLLNDCDEPIIYDEYGFRIEINEDEQEYEIVPIVENEMNQLKWLTHLDSQYKIDVVHLPLQDEELVKKINPNQFRQDSRIPILLKQSFGIPLSIRAQIWMCLSGSLHKKSQAKISYTDILKQSNNDAQLYSKQIEKDLLRTLPTNACFMSINASGISRLRRVLRAIAWLFPGKI